MTTEAERWPGCCRRVALVESGPVPILAESPEISDHDRQAPGPSTSTTKESLRLG